MAISDVLATAVEEIEWYQENFEGVYDDMRLELEALKVWMTKLQVRLDTPPTGELASKV